MVGIICEQGVVAALAFSRHRAFRPGRMEFGPNDKAQVKGSAAGHRGADGQDWRRRPMAHAWDLRSDDRQIMNTQNGRILFLVALVCL
jgi:hypothetical protein